MNLFIYMRRYSLFIVFMLIISCTNDITMPINKGNLNEIFTGTNSNITPNSANLSYIISDNGGASIIESGINLSTNVNFNTSQNLLGPGRYPGNYALQITDLIPSRVYYWRPYTKTNLGTSYGNIGTFTTQTPNSNNYSGLVTFYPFNGDLFDYSGSNNLIGGNYSTATYGLGKLGGINSSANFNSNFGLFRTNSSNFPSGSTSATFWFKSNGVGSTLFSIGSNGGGPAFTTATVKLNSRNQLAVYHWDSDRIFNFSPYDFLDGSWYFVAFTYDSSTRKCILAVYRKPINGNVSGGYYFSYTLNTNLNWSNYKNIALGCLPLMTNNYALTEFLNGQIDDFRLFNRPLSFDDLWYVMSL